jgi:hypothetical protein
MTKKHWLILIFAGLLLSCVNTTKPRELTKADFIRTFVKKAGYIDLPYAHNLTTDNETYKYSIDSKSLDSLFFDNSINQIIGVIPDTTTYFAILYYDPGDDLYPSLRTFNKSGEIIDSKKICLGYSAGCGCECDSCSDLTTIGEDLKIEMSYYIKATECDSNGIKLPETTTCKVITVEGNVKPDGTIVLNEEREMNIK